MKYKVKITRCAGWSTKTETEVEAETLPAAEDKAAFEALPPEEQARIRAEQRGREVHVAQVVTSMVALTCPEGYYGRRGRSQ